MPTTGESNEPLEIRRALAAVVGACCCAAAFAGARRNISVAAHSPDHSLSAGRHRRFRRPRAGAEARRRSGPDGRRPRTGPAPAASSASITSRIPTPDGYNIVLMDPAHRHQSDAAEIDALRHFQGSGDASRSSARRRKFWWLRRSSASRPMPSSSPTAKPIPASSITLPPASAPRRILPPRCGRCAPASTPSMCRIKASAPSFVDLMSNKVQMAFSSIAGALPFTVERQRHSARHHRR